MHLRVHVNDELVLDAGDEATGDSDRVIHPPRVTLFHQVLAYLRAKSSPPAPPAGWTIEDEGGAAAAAVLRWGSYFAVLADRSKPVWAEVHPPKTSRISDGEMARINIEASAALAEWVDICREDRGNYESLVGRALTYLPLQKTKSTIQGSKFAILAMAEVAAKMVNATSADRVASARAQAERAPSRLFSNALVNTAWRNGPVEDIHAGVCHGYPLERRRVTVREERTLMGFAADRLTTGMGVCGDLTRERPARSWPEQVLPYGLAGMMLITPSGWTLTDATREVRLPRD